LPFPFLLTPHPNTRNIIRKNGLVRFADHIRQARHVHRYVKVVCFLWVEGPEGSAEEWLVMWEHLKDSDTQDSMPIRDIKSFKEKC